LPLSRGAGAQQPSNPEREYYLRSTDLRALSPSPRSAVQTYKSPNLFEVRVYDSQMPREPFSGDDELLNIEGEPDEALKVVLGDEVGEGDLDIVEPMLDE
jgi:hypothetical protein